MSNSIIPTAILQEVMDAMDDMATDSRILDMKQSRVHQFDAARDALRAALEQPDAGIPATAPEGWKLVPVEPTRGMLDAAHKDLVRDAEIDQMLKGIHSAMLAAAPQPPEHYDQQALDLCLTCGWKALIPGDCCLICARQKPQGEQEPVGEAAFMPGTTGFTMACFLASDVPVGTKLYTHPQPKREPPQADPTPYLYYDPNNGDTWTQEAINDGCCLPDGLIALYTK